MVTALGLLSPQLATATAFEVVDQAYVFSINGGPPDYDYGTGIAGAAPLGQTFSPTLPYLNLIEVRISDNLAFDPSGMFNNLGATLQIRVYAGQGVSGTPIGVSEAVTLPPFFPSTGPPPPPFLPPPIFGGEPVRFFFPTMVSLVPGEPYTLTLFTVSGDNFITYFRRNGGYEGGTIVVNGVADTSSVSDMWFREGLVPEPSTWALLTAALAALGLCTRNRVNRS